MFQIIAWPFGKLMWLCWLLVKNYGIALLLFTILIKLIMLPSSIKQQKSVVRMAKLNPKLEQIKKKYGDNKEKINEATMELYNQEGINPMGSCLPMILTFVILFAIIEVVYAPLTYISGIDKNIINQSVTTLNNVYVVSADLKNDNKTVATLEEGTDLYELIMSVDEDGKYIYEKSAKLGEESVKAVTEKLTSFPGLDEYITNPEKVSQQLVGQTSSRAELLVVSVAQGEYAGIFDKEIVDFCDGFDYTFLGAYLGDYPKWSSWLVLIPILSLVSQLAVTLVTQYYSKKQGQAQAQGGMKLMLYGMPLFSFWLAFNYPAGLGIYWIFQSVLGLLQTIFLHMYLTPARVDKMIEKDNAKKKRKGPSLYERVLEQQKMALAEANGGKLPEKTALDEMLDDGKLTRSERKELERLRLNEARRQLEEKYGAIPEGEVPVENEDTDERLVAARKRMAEKYGDNY